MARKKRDWKTFLKWVFFPFTLPFDKSMQAEFSSGGAFDELGSQVGSLINSQTGAHLTGAQQEANEFSARMAEEEFARQEEFYLKYQSPKAMLRQGVNPFGINGSTGGQSVTGGAPTSVSASSPKVPDLFTIVQMLFGMHQQKRLNDSEIQLREAQSGLVEQQTVGEQNKNSVFGTLHNLSVEQIQTAIAKDKQSINESIQRVKESIQSVNESNSRIQVNGSIIQLNGSQSELNAAKTVVERLNAEKLSILMPYVKAREEAAIALANAQTEEALMSAEKAMYDANVSMLKGLVEAELIDGGYYENLIKSSDYEVATSEWQSKTVRRNYKWKPMNDICSNVSRLAVGAGAVIGSLKGVGSSPSAVPGVPNYANDPALSAPMFW